ncbi:MAG: hypothetical protein KatS3mg111_0458 [Pirellulaceae bacterium]|nr:MAG: hypothetical protein KatS3mg111_0458 [Pirellulaceae bacterium]
METATGDQGRTICRTCGLNSHHEFLPIGKAPRSPRSPPEQRTFRSFRPRILYLPPPLGATICVLCVLVVRIPRRIIGQENAVDAPHALWRERFLGIWKVLVLRLQESPIVPIPLLGPRPVGTEQHAILVLQQELAGRIRLPAQLADPRCEFNHHFRYVLPSLPALYITAGVWAARWWRQTWFGRWAVGAMVLMYVLSSASVLPRSYAFFNYAVGGPSQGWRWLDNSNLDWGQDILTVMKWIESNPDKRPVYYLYSIPSIDFKKLGIDADDGMHAMTVHGPYRAGWWVVSARNLVAQDYRWFREHEPTERLSVTTSVFYISPEVARRNRRAFLDQKSP